MCWYSRIRYSCGGETWNKRYRQCSKSTKLEKSDHESQECPTKRLTRLLYDGSECPLCSGELHVKGKHEASWDAIHQRPYRNLFAKSDKFGPFNEYEELWKTWHSLLSFTNRGPQGRAAVDKFFAPIFCMRCANEPGHEGRHELQCSEIDCTLAPGHTGSHGILPNFRWCDYPGCTKDLGHPPPHRQAKWRPCLTLGCTLGATHGGDHSFIPIPNLDSSRDIAAKLSSISKEYTRKMRELNQKVLNAMGDQGAPIEAGKQLQKLKISQVKKDMRKSHHSGSLADPNPNPRARTPYHALKLQAREIRIFKLEPSSAHNISTISGSLIHTELGSCPDYTALSYAWGDPERTANIRINNQNFKIHENLLWFLQVQSQSISEPKLFWIDAICINQADLRERNHQVALMKMIYTNATYVHIWLGPEAENSNLAIDFLENKGTRNLQPRGQGYRPIWTREEGRALRDLCERPYWRRMWVIQEIIHADQLTVWCGSKHFAWTIFDRLYLTLKTLEETSWFAHHELAMPVLQSSAFTMVWQRAHWRHPETLVPTLQTLIEVFQDWQSTDIRDKVYALLGMADTEVVADYSRTPRQVYYDVIKHGVHDRESFCNLLSQLLALPRGDIDLNERDL